MLRESDHSGTYSTVDNEAQLLDCHLENVFLTSDMLLLCSTLKASSKGFEFRGRPSSVR